MLRSASPALIAQEHAAWVTATELARAAARAAAAIAVPARKGKRACRPVYPREISFTAARRAVITTTRAGTATASLPASAITANRDSALASLARRRVDIDRNRDRTTKAPAELPARRAARARAHRTGPDQRLRAHRRLTFFPARRTRRPVEPAAAGSDSRTAATPAHRSHSPSNTPQATSDSAASARNARSRPSTWCWASTSLALPSSLPASARASAGESSTMADSCLPRAI